MTQMMTSFMPSQNTTRRRYLNVYKTPQYHLCTSSIHYALQTYIFRTTTISLILNVSSCIIHHRKEYSSYYTLKLTYNTSHKWYKSYDVTKRTTHQLRTRKTTHHDVMCDTRKCSPDIGLIDYVINYFPYNVIYF